MAILHQRRFRKLRFDRAQYTTWAAFSNFSTLETVFVNLRLRCKLQNSPYFPIVLRMRFKRTVWSEFTKWRVRLGRARFARNIPRFQNKTDCIPLSVTVNTVSVWTAGQPTRGEKCVFKSARIRMENRKIRKS